MISCLIADDEAPARNLIGLHLAELNAFEVAASVSNGLEAFTFLQKNKIDLMFLDINMPGMSGFELIRAVKDRPKIILTTAFREYAASAYDLDVLDYLVKPITRERFMKAVSKFMQLRKTEGYNTQLATPFGEAYHFFKSGREQIKIFLKDIIFIEGLSDYVRIHTPGRSYIISETLNYLEKNLPEPQFTRIHKSFIIALDKVSSYDTDRVKLADKVLPVGRLFKSGFIKKIKR